MLHPVRSNTATIKTENNFKNVFMISLLIQHFFSIKSCKIAGYWIAILQDFFCGYEGSGQKAFIFVFRPKVLLANHIGDCLGDLRVFDHLSVKDLAEHSVGKHGNVVS